MRGFFIGKNQNLIYRFPSRLIVCLLAVSLILSPVSSYAQGVFNLPQPGAMITVSPVYVPPHLIGLKVHQQNPFQFDFIIDSGNSNLSTPELKEEATKLIRYFLAALTVPDDELWVNLSPYEKDKIIPEKFGMTEMGRDLLTQDYLLKQLTASLIYPENDLGNEFWKRVYKKAHTQYGTTEIPVNTFNKVWIIPDRAVVYEGDDKVFIGDNHLKVMMEEDYLALRNNTTKESFGVEDLNEAEVEDLSKISSSIIKDIVIPEIEVEVNSGKNFAPLRQIYSSLILAAWYKETLKESLLGQVYVERNKIKGIDIKDKEIKQKIYAQYIDSFKKGVFNYIKEDYDTSTQTMIPRKYFSGGVWGKIRGKLTRKKLPAEGRMFSKLMRSVIVGLVMIMGVNFVESSYSQVQAQEIQSQQINEEKRKYWLSLANEDYGSLFERSGEFVNEPFAFEVLKTAVLVAPPGPYYYSAVAAMDYFQFYASHPRAFEIAQMAIENGGDYQVYDNIRNIIRAPRGIDVVKYALSRSPKLALRQLDPDSLENYIQRRESEGKFDFVEFLNELEDPIAKAILAIWNSPYDMETKENIAGLIHRIVERTLSIEAAADITRQHMKLLKELVKIRTIPKFTGRDAVISGLIISADEIAKNVTELLSEQEGRSQIDSLFRDFTVSDVVSIMIFSVRDAEALWNYLFDVLKKKLRQSDDPSKDLMAGMEQQNVREFLGLLAQHDKLLDFLPLFDVLTTQSFLSTLMEVRKEGYEFYSNVVRYPAAQLIVAQYLAEKGPLTKQQYFSEVVDQTKDQLEKLYKDDPSTRRSTFVQHVNHFLTQPFIQGLIRDIVEETAENNPEYFEFFHQSENFIDKDYGLKAFIVAAYQNPTGAMHAVFNSKKTKGILQGVKDAVIQKILELEAYKLPEQVGTRMSLDGKDEMAPLMDDFVNGMSLEEGFALSARPSLLRARLRALSVQEDVIGRFAIDEYLTDFYLKAVGRMNELHNEPDNVRFADLKEAPALDLYNIMVYGEQEIYTSTFNGVFSRLLEKMKEDAFPGDQLLQNAQYFRFRSFVRLLTNFGRLNEFLATMDELSRNDLLERFVKELEKEKSYLEQATVVAEVFSLIKEDELLKNLQKFVKEEFERVQAANHREGKVIYGILSGMFGEKAVINESWFKDMSEKFGLPRVDQINISKLFNQHSTNIQHHFFYNDEDGRSSFESFLAPRRDDPDWKITYEKNYVHLETTAPGKKIEIFANKPDKESEGFEDISAVFKERNIFAHVLVHRGHSYHAPQTIDQIKPTAEIVSLGSCGGFQLVHDVLEHSPGAHIFSTKGTGSMYVNDPLLRMLNGSILSGQDIFWPSFWKNAEKQITSDYFPQYIPPHQNIGALFMKAYNKIISELNQEQKSGRTEEGGRTASAQTLTSSPIEQHDQAMLGAEPVGGIDLNPGMLNLDIKRDENGIPLPLSPQEIQAIHIDGLVPVVIQFVPVTNLPILLRGLRNELIY